MLEGKSTVNLYQKDGVKPVKVTKKQTVKVEIPTNGGFVIVE